MYSILISIIQALDVREEITKLKVDIGYLKQEVTNLVQALASRVEAAGLTHCCGVYYYGTLTVYF